MPGACRYRVDNEPAMGQPKVKTRCTEVLPTGAGGFQKGRAVIVDKLFMIELDYDKRDL